MKYDVNLLKNLINLEALDKMTVGEIIDEIALNLYEPKNQPLRNKEVFKELPEVIQHCIVLIIFDTEVMIEGIFGFLENSSGLFLNETIIAFEKVKAYESFSSLSKIRNILIDNKSELFKLNRNLKEYDISSFSERYYIPDDLVNQISSSAEDLYLYSNKENVFQLLELYIQDNIDNLINISHFSKR